jgi:hypothetical protein
VDVLPSTCLPSFQKFLDDGSQVELARWSLEAGKKAEQNQAFIPATNYLLEELNSIKQMN